MPWSLRPTGKDSRSAGKNSFSSALAPACKSLEDHVESHHNLLARISFNANT